MNGIIVVNKPKGMTSHQVVGKVRRILGIKKIGHTGTLDPDVDGVLPLCIGSATRIAEYLLDQSKAYKGEVTFGFSTTTQDASGEVVEQVDQVFLTEEQVNLAFSRFHGEIEQIPPAFSALKVDGKRAYELARQGEQVVLAARKVTIYSIEILHMDLSTDYPRVQFRVECSKGTYIRTLCHDLGRELGVPSHMSRLTRIRSGPFTLEMSHTLEELERAKEEGEIGRYLLSASVAVEYLPVYSVSDKQERRVLNGMEMTFPLVETFALAVGDRIRIESRSGKLLAIYRVVRVEDQEVFTKPEKVFKE
ncbi:tRNA pseudouridine(55) synthase TruB [Effusibacillus consociatus]|uniref:tRNA pseudouridine synthase B n=1 Tax=Effusibacillus consociatus TaxID=1117041 RepID=A0ABV9Q4W2_9BACL